MMTSPRIADKASSLYEADYLAWIETNLEKLKGKNYDSVDWENLLEEISDMARREKRGFEKPFIRRLTSLTQVALPARA